MNKHYVLCAQGRHHGFQDLTNKSWSWPGSDDITPGQGMGSIYSTQRRTKLRAGYHDVSDTLVWYIRERDAMSESSDPLQEKCRCKSL